MNTKSGIFKKSATLVLTTALLLVSAACGNSQNKAENGVSSPSASQEASASASAPAEVIKITAWDKPHADDPKKPFYEQQFAAFDAKYPNIKVNHVEQTKTKEREQFMTAVAGGEQPDVYQTPYPTMELYIQQGITADLTDRWNGYSEKDKFLPASMAGATLDGKVYGVPRDMYIMGLMYNKKLFKDAGLDPNKAPANWDEFVDYAKKLTDPSKNMNGYDILGMDWADWFFEYYVWQAGGDLTEKNADGTVKLTFTSDAAVSALQFYKDLKFKHKVTQKNVVQSLDDNQKDFYTGHTAMQVAGSYWFGDMISKGMNISDLGFAPLPAGPSGTSPGQVGGSYWILNPKASKEKQDAAWTYVTFISSKEYLDADLKYQQDNGIFPNLLTVRSDIDLSNYVKDFPADIAEGAKKATEVTHLEYFLKERLSPYIVKAVQKVLLDESADPKAELQKAQNLAQKEVADKYNAELK